MKFKNISECSSRSSKFKSNIIVSVFFKSADTLVYLLLVPITLGYLNPYEYGIWLTLSSVLAWIDCFDIGLGNGLRNKLAESVANNDKIKARKYVSTTYFMLLMLMAILLVLGLLVIHCINWDKVLNLDKYVSNLEEIIQFSYLFFSLNFSLKFVGNVFQAMQYPAAMYIINFTGHLFSLLALYLLTITTSGNLFYAAIVYSMAPPLAYAIAYPIAFKKFFKYLAPSIRFFEKKYIKDLFNLSIMFFLLQIAGLLLLSCSNILISNLFGPAEVTPFNIAQRYFGVVLMLSNIIIAPIWSATTDAYVKKDFEWIRRSNMNLLRFLVICFLLLLIMVLAAPFVYKIWIGAQVTIPLEVSIFTALYYFILIWSLSYSYMLNGMGKLKLQTAVTIIAAVCFWPLCWYLGNKFSITGVLIGMCILNFPGAIINSIQFKIEMLKNSN